MKKRVVKYVTGACIAGAMIGMPGVALANGVDTEPAETGNFVAAEETAIALYGPPSVFDPDEPIQVLYGPAPDYLREKNPMTVTAKEKSVKASKLASAKKSFPKAIVVKNAVGTVTYQKVAKDSSKRLTVGKKSGVVTVKKGTKKGTYKAKVTVHASGDDLFLPSTKRVTVKVHVK